MKNINTQSLPTRSRSLIRRILAPISWVVLILVTLLTALLAGWILLAAVLLHSIGPGSQPIVIFLVLLAITSVLAWLIARHIASRRRVGQVIGLTLIILSIVGVTWALSAPDEALFFARDMAWPGGDIQEYLKYPQREIDNALPVFHFQQKLSPEAFQSVEYKQGGQIKQASLDELLKSTATTSFIVIKDNAILYEGYFNGYSRDSIVTSFSIAKSVTSALVGIAIDEGYISSIDDPIIYYLPELRDKWLDGITIRHLLTMSTGIRFVSKNEQSPLMRMLPFNDMARMTSFPNLRNVALSVKPDGEIPGTAWKYNDYYPQLLGIILERTTHQSVSEYLQEKIWKPLGMEYPASWSLDSTESGFEHMESGVNARAIDFAKFGLLFLNKGNWNGKQIISSDWVIESTSPDPDDNRPWRIHADWKATNGYYKYFWWGRISPDGSYVYLARGGENQQWIYLSPQDKVVIVRFGLVSGGAVWWPDVFENIVTKLK